MKKSCFRTNGEPMYMRISLSDGKKFTRLSLPLHKDIIYTYVIVYTYTKYLTLYTKCVL